MKQIFKFHGQLKFEITIHLAPLNDCAAFFTEDKTCHFQLTMLNNFCGEASVVNHKIEQWKYFLSTKLETIMIILDKGHIICIYALPTQ